MFLVHLEICSDHALQGKKIKEFHSKLPHTQDDEVRKKNVGTFRMCFADLTTISLEQRSHK